MTHNLLLEIGVEEIPARFLPGALDALKAGASKALSDRRISFSDISTYGTPRRLAAIITGAAGVQTDLTSEVFGPPKKIAYDADGNLTQAAIGFARSSGVMPEDLVIKTKGKGEYIAAVVEEKGKPARELLPDALRETVLSLHFPKAMRWGSGQMKFVRPIHWFLALMDDSIIEFDVDGIKSGNMTRGHRFLSPGAFIVKDPGHYLTMLENNFVIADAGKRKSIIREGLSALAAEVSGTLVEDEDLLQTVTNLVEYPTPILGKFPAKYLGLPEELLIIVMKDHQKFFSVRDEDGRLLNHFITIGNMQPSSSDTVRAGNERVLRARFEDARFYHEEDRERRLEDRVDDLRNVTFHDRLGSIHDKVTRIVKLTEYISDKVAPSAKENAVKAAMLAKADLTTGVVREFPELQGIMGMYYARNDGMGDIIPTAIMEHYLPRFAGDWLPSSDEGAIVGLADRMDNIAAFFLIGLKPSGSEDPFALRRQALAVLQILRERSFPLTIKELIYAALANLKHIGTDDISRDAYSLFAQRLQYMLDSEGYPADLIDSVLDISFDVPLSSIVSRLDAIKALKSSAGFNEFLAAFKRIRNIIPKDAAGEVDESLLKEAAEKSLYEAFSSSGAGTDDFAIALGRLSGLTEHVNEFFDKVMVMDKDDRIKANRLALLGAIWAAAFRVADISKLKDNS